MSFTSYMQLSNHFGGMTLYGGTPYYGRQVDIVPMKY